MPWDQAKYEQAKGLLADPGLSDTKRQALLAKVSQYEDDRARGYNAAPADEGRAPQPAIDVPSPMAQEVPKPGPGGYWKPSRPLTMRDYIPQDVGGSLAVWRDMPLDVYRKKVLEPQRQMAIAAGEKAMMELQRFGVNAFSPEDQVQRTMLIAQGKAAAAQDPSAVTEEDPGYKQFNEAQFQKAVQERAADPNAGPIQRLEQVDTSGLAGKIAYGSEKMKDYALAGARGAVDIATLGLGTGALDATTEAVAGREPVEVARGLQESHPIASGIGAGIMSVVRPNLAGPGLMRNVFARTAPALGRYGAAAAAGAAGSAVEGLGRDLSAEGADALSDSPEAAQERGRLSPGALGANTLGRAALGGAAGVVGQGVADLGRGLSNKISEMAIRGTQGRTPYEAAEKAGYQFDPVLGIQTPPGADAEKALTRETGVSWAERFAKKAAPVVVENVDKYHIAEKAAMGKENLAYFASVQGKQAPLTNLSRAASEIQAELEGVNPELASQVQRIARGLSPIMTPKQMGLTIKMLSGEANSAAAGSNELKADAMKRLQAALMEDMKGLPLGNLADTKAVGPDGEELVGWPALRQQHEARGQVIEEVRQLTGAREEGASLPDAVAAMNRNLMSQGKSGFPVAKEAALDRFMPPALKREALMLRAANMVDDISGGPDGPYPSRAGMFNWAKGKAIPRAYGLGRTLSNEVSGVKVPDTYPVSDQMFTWVNARMPRATMFVPGMDLPKMVRELAEMQNRPKRWGDLTPEQQKLLLDTLGTADQQEVLQEAAP